MYNDILSTEFNVGLTKPYKFSDVELGDIIPDVDIKLDKSPKEIQSHILDLVG